MRLSDIALSNLKRRKLKASLLVLGIVIGVASIVGLYSITQAMQQDLANKIDEFGSNMLILPATDEVSFGGVTVQGAGTVRELQMSDIAKMKTIKNKETLAIIAPKLLAEEKINGKQAMLVGVQFRQELKLKKWWKVDWLGGKKIMPGGEQVLVGSDAARVLGLRPGAKVNIKGKQLTVAGVIKATGSTENDSAIFLDLTTLQQVTNHPGAISLIEAAAWCYTCPIERVTAQLQQKLPYTKVQALKASTQSRDDTVRKFSVFSFAVSIVIGLIGAMVVMMSMMSSVKERTRDIGVLRATGFRKTHVITIVLIEAGILSLVGGIIGYAIGMGAASLFGSAIAQLPITVSWNLIVALAAIGGAAVIGLIASAYPAWRAARLDPVEALRYI
ncbi:MAG TPA: FtsX-like permease family protein [Desulfobacteria bacterium]|nr:FtsX-like permease family protein [Desulfobacteria bacterium]